jgi:hypothetical protein
VEQLFAHLMFVEMQIALILKALFLTFAPGVTVVRESEQKFSKNEPVVITNYKELVVKIQSVELLRENERFIEWIKTIRKILEKLYPDFVWPTE